jgi:rhodanese-related sulfurtransferase
MRKVMIYALGWISALNLAVSLDAQQLQQQRKVEKLSYVCDLNGVRAQLTAEIETIQVVAVYVDNVTGQNRGVVPTGEVNLHYGGTVTSPQALYTFTGTNEYADFVDQVQGLRFQVRLIRQDPQLLMIINPFGPGPSQHLCQMTSNSGAPQAAGVPQLGGVPQNGLPQVGGVPPNVGFPQVGGVPQNGGFPQLGGVPPNGGFPQFGGFPGAVPQPGRGVGAPPEPVRIDLDILVKVEREDFKVTAPRQLRKGDMDAPTPNTIPGGQLVTTKELAEMVQKHTVPFVLIGALEDIELLPEAIPAAWSASSGTFEDQTQQRLVQLLQQETKNKKDVVVVFYSDNMENWQSYNAALRAINAGYTKVLWYRGGLEAWILAGLPTQVPARGANPAQPRGPSPR